MQLARQPVLNVQSNTAYHAAPAAYSPPGSPQPPPAGSCSGYHALPAYTFVGQTTHSPAPRYNAPCCVLPTPLLGTSTAAHPRLQGIPTLLSPGTGRGATAKQRHVHTSSSLSRLACPLCASGPYCPSITPAQDAPMPILFPLRGHPCWPRSKSPCAVSSSSPAQPSWLPLLLASGLPLLFYLFVSLFRSWLLSTSSSSSSASSAFLCFRLFGLRGSVEI
jgi:hypothetical protein